MTHLSKRAMETIQLHLHSLLTKRKGCSALFACAVSLHRAGWVEILDR